jgi:hypothetical protein
MRGCESFLRAFGVYGQLIEHPDIGVVPRWAALSTNLSLWGN